MLLPMNKTRLLLMALFAFTVQASAQTRDPLPLWPNGAPGALGQEDKDIPTLTPFLPEADKATGAAVVVCPGGGYGGWPGTKARITRSI